MSLGDNFRQLELDLRQQQQEYRAPISNYFRNTRLQRKNTPSKATRHVAVTHLTPAQRQETVWIVDHMLEPQIFVNFLPCVNGAPLPNGRPSELPLLSTDDVKLMQKPLSEWAPPPYDSSNHVPIARMMTHIGSFEDGNNLVPISKELKAMKARIFAGVVPVSERRWQELDLDSPDKFHDACQYFCAVIDVFHYLNMPQVKARLRKTYNSIWDQLKIVEYSLNNIKLSKGEPKIALTRMWYEYINAFFTSITNLAHNWVTTYIERLRGPVLQQMADYLGQEVPAFSDGELQLANKLHDLVENAAQADTAIFLPMDGYKGSDLVSQDNAEPRDMNIMFRKEPLSFSANKLNREVDYYTRLKYLTVYKGWKEFDSIELTNLIDRIGHVYKGDSLAASQIIAQHQARMELRGPPAPPIDEPWMLESKREGGNTKWGFVAYRLCYEHTDEEWEEFKTKFEADISNWRNEMPGMDDIKARSTVEWREPRRVGLPENDVDAVRRHFMSLGEFDLIPKERKDEVVLAADKAAIDSYLKPTPGQGGYVLAIDVGFELNDEWRKQRAETPGYTGVFGILGSVLWDDVSASMLVQSRRLEDLWILAMDHPKKVYEGYLPRHAPA